MKQKQNGNALIFILIAIVLLGLLTVTLSRSGDSSNDTGDFEQNQIAASEILSYAKSIENAVQSLLARGCSENELSFWHDSDGNGTEDGSDDYYNANSPTDRSCHVFDVAGAGMTYQSPQKNITGVNFNLAFAGDDQIIGVGRDCASSLCSELYIFYRTGNETLCNSINKISNIPLISGHSPEEVGLNGIGKYTGSFSINPDPLGNDNDGASFVGKTTGCIKDFNEPGNYDIYHVLHAR